MPCCGESMTYIPEIDEEELDAMAKRADPSLPIATHVLLKEGLGMGYRYAGRGLGRTDIEVLMGVPEPLGNFDHLEFVAYLVEVVGCLTWCTAEGAPARAPAMPATEDEVPAPSAPPAPGDAEPMATARSRSADEG